MESEVERWLKELKKGATKFSLMAILRDGDMYGYELMREFEVRTNGFVKLTEGNAYPTLHNMEDEGLITSYWVNSDSGLPARKYYHITEKGALLLNEMIIGWEGYMNAMNNIWRHKSGNQ
jgi:PadR family transcriptional regulator PadR